MINRSLLLQDILIARLVTYNIDNDNSTYEFETSMGNLQGNKLDVQIDPTDPAGFQSTEELAELLTLGDLTLDYNYYEAGTNPVLVYIPSTADAGTNTGNPIWAGWWYVKDLKPNYSQYNISDGGRAIIKRIDASDLSGQTIGDHKEAFPWYVANVGNPTESNITESAMNNLENAVSNLTFLVNTTLNEVNQ